ncbi:hypothetical protein GO984_17985 [Rhodobacteraceae bacterium CY05]|uniref:Uncharacterized protein n=1 Tax=Parasedimentitalea huanghaiensis TaxID=2682100 RepID=A0A6L6WL42_9RHOB|nr:hypothetical protein [Zongyanglinia huanghaiensis]
MPDLIKDCELIWDGGEPLRRWPSLVFTTEKHMVRYWYRSFVSEAGRGHAEQGGERASCCGSAPEGCAAGAVAQTDIASAQDLFQSFYNVVHAIVTKQMLMQSFSGQFRPSTQVIQHQPDHLGGAIYTSGKALVLSGFVVNICYDIELHAPVVLCCNAICNPSVGLDHLVGEYGQQV